MRIHGMTIRRRDNFVLCTVHFSCCDSWLILSVRNETNSNVICICNHTFYEYFRDINVNLYKMQRELQRGIFLIS